MAFNITIGVGGRDIKYILSPGVIRIHNDDDLKSLFNETKNYCYEVARAGRECYAGCFRKDFGVSERSMVFEILLHVYPDKAARAALSLNLPILSELARKISSHTGIIDIGENDPERIFFNLLDKLLDRIIRQIKC